MTALELLRDTVEVRLQLRELVRLLTCDDLNGVELYDALAAQVAHARRCLDGAGTPPPDGTKVCGKCEQARPVTDYGRHAQTRDGLQPWCRPCRSTHSRRVSAARKNPTPPAPASPASPPSAPAGDGPSAAASRPPTPPKGRAEPSAIGIDQALLNPIPGPKATLAWRCRTCGWAGHERIPLPDDPELWKRVQSDVLTATHSLSGCAGTVDADWTASPRREAADGGSRTGKPAPATPHLRGVA